MHDCAKPTLNTRNCIFLTKKYREDKGLLCLIENPQIFNQYALCPFQKVIFLVNYLFVLTRSNNFKSQVYVPGNNVQERQHIIITDCYRVSGTKRICKNAIKDWWNNISVVKARDLLRHRLFRCVLGKTRETGSTRRRNRSAVQQ